ncbi:MAG: VanZ family protein [Cellulophaga sp.]|nr:VanZ family protein [Cellulophaga sp.]
MFITSLSLFSFKEVGTISKSIKIPHFDKIAHFTFYFCATILGSLAVKEFKILTSFKKASLYVMLFSVLYGIVIEVLQYGFTENRQGDFLDVLANSLGALTGWISLKLWFRKQII